MKKNFRQLSLFPEFEKKTEVKKEEGIIRGVESTCEVFVNGILLDPAPSQKLYNHSPDGFAWGYEGSGPAQLALALLLEICGKEVAMRHYQEFKRDIISNLGVSGDFTFGVDNVKAWVNNKVGKENDSNVILDV